MLEEQLIEQIVSPFAGLEATQPDMSDRRVEIGGVRILGIAQPEQKRVEA